MRFLIVLSVFVPSALSARLDNTYIPPPNAHLAGGQNLEAPRAFASNVQNQYAPQPQHHQQQHQQQHYNNGASQQGTYTSHQSGKGFQAASSGAYSGQNYQHSQPQAANSGYSSAQVQKNLVNNQRSEYSSQATTEPIPILKYENEPHRGDGKYRFEYLTGNGIMAQEEGYLNNPNNAQWPDCEPPNCPEQVAIGSYSYTAPDGQKISVSYKADSQGFQPEGDHLPQPVTHTPEFYAEVEKQRAIAAEIEAEGARILALQAELARNQPQQQQQQQQYGGQFRGQSSAAAQVGHQGQQHYQPQSSNSYNYQAQSSNNVYQQRSEPQKHSGYNQNSQPVNPQQSYLPPHQQRNYGKK
jgi:hypothetical protein